MEAKSSVPNHFDAIEAAQKQKYHLNRISKSKQPNYKSIILKR